MAQVVFQLVQTLKKYSLYPVSLILLFLLITLANFPPVTLDSLAKAINDDFYQWNKSTPAEKLVFIEIDNKSVKQFGRWPWDRKTIADGIKQLNQAEVIGLDILFSEPTNEQDDSYLAATLAELPIIGGIFLNGAKTSELTPEQLEQISYSALGQTTNPQLISSDRAELPIPLINQSMTALAALNILADADHKFRKYPLAFWLEDFQLPNLAMQIWRLAKQEDLILQGNHPYLGASLEQSLQLPADKQTRSLLNFYPQAAWQTISFADLFNDDFQPESLAGKWVIVGISEAGVSDIRATPIGNISGPIIHLTQLSNLLQDELLTPTTPTQMSLILFTLLLLSWLIWQVKQPWLRTLLYLSLGVGIYSAGILLYTQAQIWLEVIYPLLLLFTLLILGELWLFITTRAEQTYTRNAFKSYISPELVEQLVKSKKNLTTGGEKQPLTILFSDLRDFTKTTEALDPDVLIKLLNDYFNEMIEVIQEEKGTLDKLIGDAIMAFFNAPLPVENHAYHACIAAAKMMQSLKLLNQTNENKLQMGIGINTGDKVLVGNLGASNRFNYTAIGDAVNVAARLESAVKEENARYQQNPIYQDKGLTSIDILIGEATYEAVKDKNLPLYELEPLSLKGKSEKIKAWALDWRNI